MKRKFSAATATLVLLAGCAAKVPPASMAITPADCAPIWNAAASELQAEGFQIAAYYPLTSTMRTRTKVMPGTVPCGALSCPYRDTIYVTVAPRGEVLVKIDRELAIPTAGWRPPTTAQPQTVAQLNADQDTVLQSILARAKGAPLAPPASAGAPAQAAPTPAQLAPAPVPSAGAPAPSTPVSASP